MNKVIVKAPGKVMIMGEHAVVYGYPCIVTSIDKYLTVTACIIDSKQDQLSTPAVADQSFIQAAIRLFKQKYGIRKCVQLETESELGGFGFGSSAATVVATLKTLSILFQKEVTDSELFQLGLSVVLDIQKQASGFDVAASIFGGTIYFNGKTKEIIPVTSDPLPLTAVYTGSKADTVSMINQVRERRVNFKRGVDAIFESIEKLVLEAKTAIQEKNWERLGTLMNYNQNYLEDLGVSNESINTLIHTALKAGAYGAKISGAGGGDSIIIVTPEDKNDTIVQQLKNAGGEIVSIKTSVIGAHQIFEIG
jgi:mevalonate kinase